MKKILLLILTTSQYAFTQTAVNVTHYQTNGPDGVTALGGIAIVARPPVQGAPYSATITDKVTQTLTDGSLIVQTSTGSVARDSEGRTREDAPMPSVDDASIHPPRLVFLQDPVAHTSYVLDLTNKTAQKAPLPPAPDSNGTAVVQVRTAFAEAGAVAMDEPSDVPMVVSTQGISRN